MVTKAPAVAPTTWWYEGYAEIGGRFDMNDPNQRSLGRFYRYEDLRPGVFGNFYYGAHRTGPDPWDLAFWGTNAGWDDQAFGLEMSKPGTYYLTFGWDETPHVYSKDAKTTFGPVGGNVLTSPTYGVFVPGVPPAITAPTLGGAQAVVNANTNIFDLGIRRDTASFQGRWTPDTSWDITAGYSHLHREGTQQLSTENSTQTTNPVNPGNPTITRTSIQLAKPVDDTTQNGNIKAEYAGSSFWGKPFNVAMGYNISVYNDEVGCGTVPGTVAPTAGTNCLTYNNPWVAAPGTAANSYWNRYPLPPDNQAHTFSLTGGAGLPLNSRYMGTFQYTWMTQDDPFLPSAINAQPAFTPPGGTPQPGITPAALSRTSLGGDARTLMSNNVINTQITSDVTSTLRYKYYDYHSNQSPMTITGLCNRPDSSSSGSPCTQTVTAFPTNFTKQNGNAEVVYRPWKWLDVGGVYEWEQWRHIYGGDSDEIVAGSAGTATTNEHAGKAFFDAKWGWSTLRTSVRFSERRLDGTYINPSDAAASFRNVDLQDRNSTIVKSSWDINLTNSVTVTPNGGYRLDDYSADGVSTNGISKYESWNAGTDLSWLISPMATVYISYTHEEGQRDVFTNPVSGTAVASPARTFLSTRDSNDVFIVGGRYTAIPDTLYLTANYTYSRGTSHWDQNCGPTGLCNSAPVPYPDTHNTNHRIDAQAKYMLDKSMLRNAGMLPTAQPYVKFRVIYEKNSNDSWQNIDQQLGWALPGADATLQRAIFLGMPDPNYTVVVGMVSFGVKW